MRVAHWPPALQWAVLVIVGGGLGLVLQMVRMPAGLMVGPLLVGAAMGIRGAGVRVPSLAFQAAQAVAGCLIALNIDASILGRMGQIWPIVILFVVLTFLCACIVGAVAGKWSGIDREVAVWGFLPGMAGTVIAIAHERGLDSRMVAFIQILRLMVVIVSMVLAAVVLVGAAVPYDGGHAGPDLQSTLTALAVIATGPLAVRFLPMLPAGASLVPLSMGVVLAISGVNIAMPGWLVEAGFLGLGLQIGLRFTPDLLRTGIKALPALLAASVLLIALCACSGVVLSLVTGVDLMSALLATVPGSIDSIAIIAIGAKADVGFVMTLQTVRLFAVALLGPIVAGRMIRLMTRIRPV